MRNSKILIIAALLAVLPLSPLKAQNQYQWVLDTLEHNSMTLKMLEQRRDANQAEATAGSLLENPTLEVSLFGLSPRAASGPRHDVRVGQTFDFPTVYVHRQRIRQLNAAMAQSGYERHRMEFMLEARNVCTDLVYYNAYVTLYSHCVESARRVAEIYGRRLESGDCSVIDYNRTQTELAAVETKLRAAETERDLMRDNLRMLNQGKAIAFVQDTFSPVSLPGRFEDWLDEAQRRNPLLTELSQQSAAGAENVALSKALWVPKLTAGYVSEVTSDEAFRGLSLGLSLPLWERKGTVKQATLRQAADKAEYDDAVARYRSHMRGLYAKAATLERNLTTLRGVLDRYNSEELLLKSLNAGEISLEYYLQSVEFYHDTEIDILEMEHELEHTVQELYQYYIN